MNTHYTCKAACACAYLYLEMHFVKKNERNHIPLFKIYYLAANNLAFGMTTQNKQHVHVVAVVSTL